ncbi:MAG: threonylcarbamoyl-AMP synthase [Actinobacteria bacterium]|uniref:Threonylcarbamoyl-AMP synthase n=1 Tax=freshwater metagenome TaxID=449393 RepID=A0A6J5YES9_9ZZZZ|nr:threonylcarbamoyl-AMP synthase [Actinomycetota bacterium]
MTDSPQVVSGPEGIAIAAAALRAGQLVALPTETVYGLGADASNPDAVAEIFRVKGRPTNHPLIVHIADASVMGEWAAEVSPEAQALADAFWPGPLTVLVRRMATVGDWVTGGRDTVGLRVPGDEIALELLRAFGGGIAAPSANRFGKVSPTSAAHVVADLGSDVAVVLDGGVCAVGVESTIVDVSGDEIVVLRLGGVSVEALADVLGFRPRVEQTRAVVGEAVAPGMLAAHYSPAATVVICGVGEVVALAGDLLSDDAPDVVVGVLAPHVIDGLPAEAIELEPAGEGVDYAYALYARLRQADRLGITHLLCVPPMPVGVGAAVLDRLQRAAASSGLVG